MHMCIIFPEYHSMFHLLRRCTYYCKVGGTTWPVANYLQVFSLSFWSCSMLFEFDLTNEHIHTWWCISSPWAANHHIIIFFLSERKPTWNCLIEQSFFPSLFFAVTLLHRKNMNFLNSAVFFLKPFQILYHMIRLFITHNMFLLLMKIMSNIISLLPAA